MMQFTEAIVRVPGEDFGKGITTSGKGEPDYEIALKQHGMYIECLSRLGLTVTVLPPLPGFPDSHFVEDVAVLVPEGAVITRPGAPARQGEELAIMGVLTGRKKLIEIKAPATLDGGDVLLVGREFFVGLSERTNKEGVAQFAQAMETWGYRVTAVKVGAGLHFKSSVNGLGDGMLLVTKAFANTPELAHHDKVVVPAGEEYAANVLAINGVVMVPKGFEKTVQMLRDLKLVVWEMEVSEMEKMDGGLTCMSLRF